MRPRHARAEGGLTVRIADNSNALDTLLAKFVAQACDYTLYDSAGLHEIHLQRANDRVRTEASQ